MIGKDNGYQSSHLLPSSLCDIVHCTLVPKCSRLHFLTTGNMFKKSVNKPGYAEIPGMSMKTTTTVYQALL